MLIFFLSYIYHMLFFLDTDTGKSNSTPFMRSYTQKPQVMAQLRRMSCFLEGVEEKVRMFTHILCLRIVLASVCDMHVHPLCSSS